MLWLWLWLLLSFTAGFLLGNLFGMRSALRWTTMLRHIVLGALWPGYPLTYPMKKKPASPVGHPQCVLCRQRKVSWGGQWKELDVRGIHHWVWTCTECLEEGQDDD